MAKRSRDDVWADILSASTKDEFLKKARSWLRENSSLLFFSPTIRRLEVPTDTGTLSKSTRTRLRHFRIPKSRGMVTGSIQETTHTGRRYVDLVLGH